ncbi:MAG: O-antigen ligase family protein [Erythrobacter sp.]
MMRSAFQAIQFSSGSSHSRNLTAFALTALLASAIIFGGGGVRYGFANLFVQLAALFVLGLNRTIVLDFWRSSQWSLRALTAFSIAIPIIHLVPMPTHILGYLPGRELVLQSLELAESDRWFPISVDPARTLVALIGLILPFTVLAIGWSVSRENLVKIGWGLVLLGMVNLIPGFVQVLSEGKLGLFYPENPMPGVFFGTFANRNSTGLFLLSAFSLASLLPAPFRHKAFPFARLVICILLLLAIVLTRSRTAMVLSAVPILIWFFRSMGDVQSAESGFFRRIHRFRLIGLLAGAIGAIAILGLLTASPGRIGQSLERFEAIDDARAYIWDDAAYTADKYWPIGTGMGTFDEVFQLDESLENLSSRRAGRAHNDYIEITIEAGVLGLFLVAGWLILAGWYSWKARKSRHRWAAWAGSVILLCIALQSITDYPLRNQAMLAVASFALVLLFRMSADERRSSP